MFQLAGPAQAEIEVKKSRFIGLLYPTTSRTDARVRLAEVRALHPGAAHCCWALLCDGDAGMDDDGEPAGTAARPIYNVLVHKNVGNVLAVVVRYWGGIKLGAGGLTRAYGQAVSEAMKNAVLVPVVRQCERRVAIRFADESALRRLCEQRGIRVVQADYGEAVTLHLRMPADLAEAFVRQATDLLRGELRVLPES